MFYVYYNDHLFKVKEEDTIIIDNIRYGAVCRILMLQVYDSIEEAKINSN